MLSVFQALSGGATSREDGRVQEKAAPSRKQNQQRGKAELARPNSRSAALLQLLLLQEWTGTTFTSPSSSHLAGLFDSTSPPRMLQSYLTYLDITDSLGSCIDFATWDRTAIRAKAMT